MFYDLETSGFSPRDARIMQFAGQRTDMDLNPIGEPHNFLIKISEDVLPEPDAILITGITPQKTLAEGITEAEFLKIFHTEIALAGTIFAGFNTVRFDDEFMRFLHYRNYYDPYEWQWQNERSRWDLLDLVRMTRALRPEGIKWPFDSQGYPTNRLELLASVNNLSHQNAHDALSDVLATIELAKLIKEKQPDLFNYLLKMRKKDNVAEIVLSKKPFVYSSGKYESEFEKTTVVALLAEHPDQSGAALVFDLRHDPTTFLEMDASALADAWRKRKDDPGPRLPVKTIKFNRCPAVAPLGVLDPASQQRLKLLPKVYEANYKKLLSAKKELSSHVFEALELLNKKQQVRLLENEGDVDTRLYDGFINNKNDQQQMNTLRTASEDELINLSVEFNDSRLKTLLSLYKARNFPKTLTESERKTWEQFKMHKLTSGGVDSKFSRYFRRLGELSERKDITDEQRYLLEELQLYGQSILPMDVD